MLIAPLGPEHLAEISWSGDRLHLTNVAGQLERVAAGQVEYYAVFVDGRPVAKAGVDFAAEDGAATVWQVATHPDFEGQGLATALMRHAEERARARGVRRMRLGVEVENVRAHELYKRLDYFAIGESVDEWEAEAADGSACMYHAVCIEMAKDLAE